MFGSFNGPIPPYKKKVKGVCCKCGEPALSELWTACEPCLAKMDQFDHEDECLRASKTMVNNLAASIMGERRG